MAGFSDIVFDQTALNELLKGPNGAVARQIESLAARVETKAKRLCPVDTGRLRSSIRHYTQMESAGVVGYVGTNVYYAIYQEFGTRYQRAQPFLRPALDALLGPAGSAAASA